MELQANMLIIERVNAGWVVTYTDDETGDKEQTVFEDKDNGIYTRSCGLIELTTLAELLRWIPENFGVFWSDHNDYNINVKVETHERD